MGFSNNVITTAGLNLIANATSANPITYLSCVSSTTAYTAIELATATDPSTWTGPTGTIFSASATGTTSRVVVSIPNQASSYTLKSIGVVAKLQSQDDADAIVIAGVSDANAGIYIPSTSEPDAIAQVAVNIGISDADTVNVTTATGATIADLERFVSIHKAGDTMLGDKQTILGRKTFMNGVNTSRLAAHSGTGVTVAASFLPETNNTYTIGSPSASFSAAYIKNINAQNISTTASISCAGDLTCSGNLSVDGEFTGPMPDETESAQDTMTVPVGATVGFIYTDTAGQVIQPGSTINAPVQTYFSGGVSASGECLLSSLYIPKGIYRVLFGIESSASNGEYFVLAVREPDV